jgi:hypothetical protein
MMPEIGMDGLFQRTVQPYGAIYDFPTNGKKGVILLRQGYGGQVGVIDYRKRLIFKQITMTPSPKKGVIGECHGVIPAGSARSKRDSSGETERRLGGQKY